jgi:hypothetical protein
MNGSHGEDGEETKQMLDNNTGSNAKDPVTEV